MKTEQIFKKSLKRGFILRDELDKIYPEENDLNGILTLEEIKRLDEIGDKLHDPDEQIQLTYRNKRDIIKYLFSGELPQEMEFRHRTNIDRLNREERQFLIDMALKLEERAKTTI